ncbi:MAG: DNA methylase [Oscillospiraceae bacterium]|nr:DNA methylase [Oscillospiraceae bacterium]
MAEKCYIAIDLKSFYASVECVERQRDPLTTHLVVADESRTEKTICLAVSPSLKAYGIPGRARLFEVVQQARRINAQRRQNAPGRRFSGTSDDAGALAADPGLELGYIVAVPRMALYMEYSTRIYQIYMNYVAPEDIHVYSIDEVFMDATDYLKTTGLSAHDFARRIIQDVLRTTGITATAGIGSNLYLCKVAMDIWAKHVPADKDGVRIAELDEMSYRKHLWGHRPLTDFWRVGRGYARKLEANGLLTMGDIARCSLGGPGDVHNEELLYKLFGINAELLIDHAWGWEPCTIADIKAYKPSSNSISVGQVLQEPYSRDRARVVFREMVDGLVLDLLEKGLVTDQVVLTVGYDTESLSGPGFRGEVTTDFYGRKVPKSAHGSGNIGRQTASQRQIMDTALALYERIVDKKLLIRRMYVVANHVLPAELAAGEPGYEQLDLFADPEETRQEREREKAALEREQKRQQAMLDIKKKYGKNAILHGTSYQEGATGRERNQQIGGHKA